MSLIVKHEEEVVCDICGKPIPKIRRFGFLGDRFMMIAGIFGKTIHADICYDCKLVLILASKKKGEAK